MEAHVLNQMQIIINNLSNGVLEISLLLVVVIIIMRRVVGRCRHQA